MRDVHMSKRITEEHLKKGYKRAGEDKKDEIQEIAEVLLENTNWIQKIL